MSRKSNSKLRSVTTNILIMSLIAGIYYVPTVAQTEKCEEYKEFVVLVDETKETKINQMIEDEGIQDKVLEVDDICALKINATEQQVDKITEENDVMISEDIMLNATSNETIQIETGSIKSDNEGTEWNIKMINAENSKKEGRTQKVKVAILDSGIDYTDEIDVKKRINLVPGEENVFTPFEDTTGHGTSIAGIIAAKDNGEGITGINPNVEIYSARILDDNNQAPLSRVVEGIYWAINEKVNIISISFGTNQNTEVLHKAIKDAYNTGILIIASAGNNGGAVEYPAAYNEVMAVGSVDASGTLSDTSSRGKQLDIVAPGECVKTTGSFGGELITSGTSISVPHVVGVASLLWEKDTDCSNEFIKDLLVASSNKSNDKITGNRGILDLDYAISIYDKYKDNYNENVDMEDIVGENDKELKLEDSEVVNARWELDGHVTLADKAGNWCEVSSTKIKILKLGIKYPDQKYPGMTDNPQWHTSNLPDYSPDNYISSYRCATKIARAIKNGKAVNESNISRPKGMKTANYNKMISQVKGIPWSTALDGVSVTADNKAFFVIGMAIHIVTDTFAHQSYRKVNGEWKLLQHSNDETKDCDNINVVKNRFTLAQSAANDVLATYLYGDLGDHWEYVQDYDGSSFRLHKLVQYAKNQETYNANTFGELETLKKGSLKDD